MPIDSHLSYLEKHAFVPPQLTEQPSRHLSKVFVIPCMDDPSVIETLESLWNCVETYSSTEVIVVINCPEDMDSSFKTRQLQLYERVDLWAQTHRSPKFACFVLYHDNLPRRHAGVGLARKIGMDEALHRFELNDSYHGWIISLDADVKVPPRFLYTFHDWYGNGKVCYTFDFEYTATADPQLRAAVVALELADRVHTAGLRLAGYPFAVNIGGGAIAVQKDAYAAQSGMNRRKVGEDIDFVQKYLELGQHATVTKYKVEIAGRVSTRKPGGMGRRTQQLLEGPGGLHVTPLPAYLALRQLLETMDGWYDAGRHQVLADVQALPTVIGAYFLPNALAQEVEEAQRYTTSQAAFRKRLLRSLHYHRIQGYLRYSEQFFPLEPVAKVAHDVRQWVTNTPQSPSGLEEMLAFFRQLA